MGIENTVTDGLVQAILTAIGQTNEDDLILEAIRQAEQDELADFAHMLSVAMLGLSKRMKQGRNVYRDSRKPS
jgi:hypothetical protein